MKKEYQNPEIQVVDRVGVDVITASPTSPIDNDHEDNWNI